jgi:hypothetical protein
MVVEKASGRVPERAPGSSRSWFDDGGGLQYVSRKSDPSLRFFPLRGLYRRRGVVRRWARQPHHGWAWPGAGSRPPVVWLASGPLCLIFGLHEALVKIGGSVFTMAGNRPRTPWVLSCEQQIIALIKVRNVNKANVLRYKNVVFSLVPIAHLQPYMYLSLP